jgi:hypothetical protein
MTTKNKTKKELTKEVNALKKALKTKKEVTLQDVKAFALESGKKVVAQAEQAGAETLKKVEGKIVEKFNETSAKVSLNVVKAVFSVSQKIAGLKSKILKK